MRTIEIFVAGCPCCDAAVEQVRALTCPNCEVVIRNMASDPGAQAKARELGIKRVPAVAVDGKLAECCEGGVSEAALRRLGVGSAA